MKILKLKIYQPTAHYRTLFTSSRQMSIPINLNFCFQKNKNCSSYYFYSNSYVFQTPDNKILLFKLKSPELLAEFTNCGPCENLEILENIKYKFKNVVLIVF